MKMIWLNFYDVILNTLREIEFSFKKSHFSTIIFYNEIRVVHWMLKPMKIHSVGI